MANYSHDETLKAYFALMQEHMEWFRDRGREGIAILVEPGEIEAARNATRDARNAVGLDTRDLRTGVLARDPYMTMLRDAVRFPDGSLGLYNRIVERESVAVLPLLDGKTVLVKIFRHGLRDWYLEFPRGGSDPGESAEDAARRELFEEIGAGVTELIPLGEFTPGGSSLTIRAELFAAHIDGIGSPERKDGIEEIHVAEIAEVEELIRNSEIIDGFTLALFVRARLNGVI